MSEAPEARYWATQDGSLWRVSQFSDSDIALIRADVADEWKRQRDQCLEALRAAREFVDWHAAIDGPKDDEGWPLDDAACTLKEVDDALTACEPRVGSDEGDPD